MIRSFYCPTCHTLHAWHLDQAGPRVAGPRTDWAFVRNVVLASIATVGLIVGLFWLWLPH